MKNIKVIDNWQFTFEGDGKIYKLTMLSSGKFFVNQLQGPFWISNVDTKRVENKLKAVK